MARLHRRSFMLGSGLAVACASTAARAQTRQAGSVAERSDVDSLIETERSHIREAMARDDIPGVSVCFVHAGKPAWIEGFGVTDRHSTRKVATDTIFSVQSTSKNFTATAILLAVQHGLLDLDAPILSYLPDFTVRSRFEPRPHEKMTLRILLANRAGFTHEAPVGNNYDPTFPNFEAHARSISQTWLRYPAGERYRYSNLGFDLAGYILQVRSAMPFAECLKQMVFEPLGMKDSTVATDEYATRANRALGHEHGYTQVPLKTPLLPSGGVYTSARDMAAYCRFHLDRGKVNGRPLLKEALWNEMHAFPFGGDYSLGVIRTELRYGNTDLRMLSHQGGGFGFGCVFNYCPQAGVAWVALFNRGASSAYRFGKELIDQALTQHFGAARPRLPIEDLAFITPPAAWLEKCAGNYVGRDTTADLEIKDGTLYMRRGETLTPVHFASPDELYIGGASYRYYAASPLEPAHLECSIGEDSLDYNDGTNDPKGPDRPEWNRYEGTYHIHRWGKASKEVLVHRKNGYLYLDRIRLLTELEPGLFFTSDGEALDFRSTPPTWKNLRLDAFR